MHKIPSNIKHLRQLKKWSQDQLAEKLEIPRARIGSYEEGRCVPPVETMINLSNLFHIAIDALIKCDLRKFDADSFMGIGENRLLFPIMVDKDNNDVLEVVTLKASAGYMRGYADPEYIEKLPTMNLPFRIHGKHRAFPIQGDSMPPLKTGSYVIGKYIEQLSDIVNGATYILLTKDEGVVYKRVYKKGNLLELHSDNLQYQPYTIKTNEVIEIWKFVCALQLSDKKEDMPSLGSIMQQLQKIQYGVSDLRKFIQ